MKLLSPLVIFSLLYTLSICADEEKKAPSSLAITSNGISHGDAAINDGSSSPKKGTKIFIPTDEWKVVEEDDVIFNGLHYRINVATGLKEAKLMEGSDGSKYLAAARRWLQARQKEQAGTLSPEEKLMMQELGDNSLPKTDDAEALDHESFLAKIKEIDDSYSAHEQESKDKVSPEINGGSQGRKFRSYEELKQELADLNLLMESEQNVVAKKILIHLNLTTVDEQLESLGDFEYLLHNSDNALAFIDNGGLKRVLLPALSSTSEQVRLLGCRLVSAAVQNFAKAQIAAHEAGLLARLLKLIVDDQEVSVKRAALSGLSSLVRHFPLAQQQLVSLGQEALTVALFGVSEETPAPLRWKMVRLLSDLLTERQDEASRERQEQLEAANLEASLADVGWCQFLVREFRTLEENVAVGVSLNREQRSVLEALLQAAGASGALCEGDLRSSLPLLIVLQDKLRAGRPYEGDANDSDDSVESYDTELADRVLRIVEIYENIKKEEL